jgi:hypothetical protein
MNYPSPMEHGHLPPREPIVRLLADLAAQSLPRPYDPAIDRVMARLRTKARILDAEQGRPLESPLADWPGGAL